MKRLLAWAISVIGTIVIGTIVIGTNVIGIGVIQAGTPIQFRTIFGDIQVELYDRERPITVSNFLSYVNSGRYDNTFFHRLETGFVIQGGGFTVSDSGTPQATIYDVLTGPTITNEFHVAPFISNSAGTIAMAKTSDPNSASSQFFFNLGNNASSLDDTNNSGGFTVFGHTVGGTNVLAKFNSFVTDFSKWTNMIVDLNPALVGFDSGPFGEVPLLRLNTNYVVINTNFPAKGTNLAPSVFFDTTNLLFVDITTLNVVVTRLPSGSHQIAWVSATDATNFVEFTTKLPPVWQVLTNLVRPLSGTNIVVDKSTDTHRFYRIRAAY